MYERQSHCHPPLHSGWRRQVFEAANSDSHWSRCVCVLFYFIFSEDVPGGGFGCVSLMLRRCFMSLDPAALEPDGGPHTNPSPVLPSDI